MATNKKDERERELDSFLERARESKNRRDDFEDWRNAPPQKAPRGTLWNLGLVIDRKSVV